MRGAAIFLLLLFLPAALSTPAPVAGSVSSDLVFAGYGIEAKEWGWDDFKGVDVEGMVLLLLAGEPGGDDPAEARLLLEGWLTGPAAVRAWPGARNTGRRATTGRRTHSTPLGN